MNKEEALEKIEELQKFIREYDKDIVFERLVDGGKWEDSISPLGNGYTLICKNLWNCSTNDGILRIYMTEYGDYEVFRCKDGKEWDE